MNKEKTIEQKIKELREIFNQPIVVTLEVDQEIKIKEIQSLKWYNFNKPKNKRDLLIR